MLLVFPPGMFCSQPGLSQPTGPCEAGYYCPAGSTSPNSTAYQVLFVFSVVLQPGDDGSFFFPRQRVLMELVNL